MVDNLNKWKIGLSKSSKIAFGRIANAIGITEINEETWFDLEATLIQADIGFATTEDILDSVKESARKAGITKGQELQKLLKEELRKRVASSSHIEINKSPYVIMLVGVNGSGKTTSAAKLGSLFKSGGKSVLFIAADTFRAAAVEQLNYWAQTSNIPIISGKTGSDPGAIVYDGIQSSISRNIDVVIVDTAGRLHSKFNLMEEIKKVHRVAGKSLEGAPHATWLVLDASTGQNGMQQAKIFNETIHISGIIVAKLDTSSKGGMVFSIEKELGIPILFAGLGEGLDDLQPFDPDSFVEGIMA